MVVSLLLRFALKYTMLAVLAIAVLEIVGINTTSLIVELSGSSLLETMVENAR